MPLTDLMVTALPAWTAATVTVAESDTRFSNTSTNHEHRTVSFCFVIYLFQHALSLDPFSPKKNLTRALSNISKCGQDKTLFLPREKEGTTLKEVETKGGGGRVSAASSIMQHFPFGNFFFLRRFFPQKTLSCRLDPVRGLLHDAV